MTAKTQFLPQPGERALIIGATGSGKTAFFVWLVLRLQQTPAVIYDTKEEEKFPKLPASVIVTTKEALLAAVNDPKVDYVIVRPPAEELGKPDKLDDWLWYHYVHLHHIPACLDEAGEFHTTAGLAGKGLMALLSRGRSKGITTIAATQRPRRISLSLLTESTKAYIFYLKLEDDKKRIGDLIPNYAKLPNPPKYSFYFYVDGDERPRLFAPIKLDAKYDTGYVSKAPADTGEGDAPLARHVWV